MNAELVSKSPTTDTQRNQIQTLLPALVVPATASSIFLTTATDVASMGTFLGLASLLVK